MGSRILSLGAGVQSSTVFLMSCRGELPKLDAAVFADTQWEPKAVYENLEWLEARGREAGIPVHRVTAGDLRQHTIEGVIRGTRGEGERETMLPVSTSTGSMLRRQCTNNYKVIPINRFLKREVLGLRKGQRAPLGAIDLWMGISADEARRIRMSREPWKTHIYPLCNLPDQMIEQPMRRSDCLAWLGVNYPERNFPRSACLGCPYHSNAEWRMIKDNDYEAWVNTVGVDHSIRHSDKRGGDVFLHSSGVPLDDVDLTTAEDMGQMSLWRKECLGMCGV